MNIEFLGQQPNDLSEYRCEACGSEFEIRRCDWHEAKGYLDAKFCPVCGVSATAPSSPKEELAQTLLNDLLLLRDALRKRVRELEGLLSFGMALMVQAGYGAPEHNCEDSVCLNAKGWRKQVRVALAKEESHD